MGTITRAKTFAAALAMTIAVAAPAVGQETLQHVKDLYASAAYEDALGVLARLQSPDQRLEIERYRVYCLIALDRPAEAEKAILGILTEDPLYSPEDAAPRVVDLFKRVKRQAAPQLARALYTDGKAAMGRKEQDQAARKFEQLLKLTDDAELRNDALISELRLLASGFLDLARAAAPVAAPPRPSATTATATTGSVPAPTTSVVTPPVPLRQDLPRWVPYDEASRQAEYRGAIKVMISAEGKVQSAEIVTPTDRQYDRQLLNAARGWLYEPAKRDGVPISSEKVVSVYLRPR